MKPRPPFGTPFRSAELKLAHARKLKRVIDKNLIKVAQSGATKVRVVPRSIGTSDHLERYEAVIATPIELPAQFSLHLGDCVHNISAAFDHIATELVLTFGGSEKRSLMPFAKHMSDVRSKLSDKTYDRLPPEVKTYILDIIKPYQEGNFVAWAIRKLDNIDKHRMIVPAISVSAIDVSYRSAGGAKFEHLVVHSDHSGILEFPTVNAPIENLVVHETAVSLKFNEPEIFCIEAFIDNVLGFAARTALFAINELSELVYGQKDVVKF